MHVHYGFWKISLFAICVLCVIRSNFPLLGMLCFKNPAIRAHNAVAEKLHRVADNTALHCKSYVDVPFLDRKIASSKMYY